MYIMISPYFIIALLTRQVYGNNFAAVEAAAISIRALPQWMICANTCEGDSCFLLW